MTPERWQHVKGVLQQVLEISPPHRAAFLNQACDGDELLRLEVESLLMNEEAGAEGFLETPLWTSAVFESALADSWVGRRIGAYQIVDLIGEGGMGSVYRGLRADKQYEKQVALKVVRQGLGTAFALAQFRAERQILANLDHPHIARLLDGGTTETGLPYLVMELVEGEPIDKYCNSRKLSIDDRLRLFLRVCSGVQYAHQHLVIHRDLKPGNIFVTADGTPKLLDFGIAKILDPGTASGAAEPTLNMMRMLTPEYASPEQVRGEVVTTASDVYSLGVVLFRLLTGQHPFRSQGQSPDEILRATRDTEPPRPSTAARWEQNAQLPGSGPGARTFEAENEDSPEKLSKRLRGDLDNIVLMALRKEPQRRYVSAEHFAEDIRRHLESLPVRARADTFRYRASKFIIRHKKGVLVGAVVAAILVALMVGVVWEAHIARVQRMKAERRFQDVRALANSLIFDVHDSIQDLAGATVARKLIVDKALQYLDSLDQESQGDASLQRELAEAYKRIGDVQGNEFSANLGDTTNALKSYEKALAIREKLWAAKSGDLGDALALAELYRLASQTQLFAGEVTAGLETSKKAVALMEPQELSHADDPKVLLELIADYQSVANILGGDLSLSNLGDNDAALEYRRKQLDTAEHLAKLSPTDVKALGNLAIAITTMGDQLWQGGETSSSLEYYTRARPLFEEIAFHSNKGARGRYLLGLLFERIMIVQLSKGNVAESRNAAHEALKLSSDLSAADPRNVQSGSTMAMDYRLVADLESRRGHSAEAMVLMNKAMDIAHRLVILSPKDTEVQGLQADLQTTSGDIAGRTGDYHRALKNYEGAITVLSGVATNNSKNAGAGLHLAANYNALARAQQKLHATDAATAAFQKALELTDASAKSGHPNGQTLYTRADAYAGLGEVEAGLAADSHAERNVRIEHWRQAVSWYKQSSEIWSRIKEPGIISPDGFDCVPPSVVHQRLSQCEENLRRLLASV
jgi:serine/threonine protein kinase/tetratricopeptide (TPR) repeat protein